MGSAAGRAAPSAILSLGRAGGVPEPFHPLLSIGFSVAALTTGLLLRPLPFFAFLSAASVLLVVAGYGKALARLYAFTLVTGAALAGLAVLLGESLPGAVMILGRVTLVGLSMALVATIDPTRLSRALCQARCPRALALGVLISVNFVPVLKQESDRIREAMRARGVVLRWHNAAHLYRALVLPLLIRLISISDTLTLSLETRGFAVEGRGTVYRPVTWRQRDYLYLGAFAVMLAAAWAYGVMAR